MAEDDLEGRANSLQTAVSDATTTGRQRMIGLIGSLIDQQNR